MTQLTPIPDVCKTNVTATAIDSSWLYGNPDYTLKVIGVRRSLAEASRGEWQIRLRVTSVGMPRAIELWQFAKHYTIATPELMAQRLAQQHANGFIPWSLRRVAASP
jgi:hypothetical protein